MWSPNSNIIGTGTCQRTLWLHYGGREVQQHHGQDCAQLLQNQKPSQEKSLSLCNKHQEGSFYFLCFVCFILWMEIKTAKLVPRQNKSWINSSSVFTIFTWIVKNKQLPACNGIHVHHTSAWDHSYRKSWRILARPADNHQVGIGAQNKFLLPTLREN